MYSVFTLLSTITLKLVYVYHYMKKYAQLYIENINKNLFNNLLINVSPRPTFSKIAEAPHRTRTRTRIRTHASQHTTLCHPYIPFQQEYTSITLLGISQCTHESQKMVHRFTSSLRQTAPVNQYHISHFLLIRFLLSIFYPKLMYTQRPPSKAPGYSKHSSTGKNTHL